MNKVAENSEAFETARKLASSALGFRSNGRVMEPTTSSIAEGYREIQLELVQKSKDGSGNVPREVTPEALTKIGEFTGTHLVKLVCARIDSKKSGTVLLVRPKGQNRHTDLYPSNDAATTPFAKLVHRPMEIKGFEARSLAAHILEPDEVSPKVKEAFTEVFGAAPLDALIETLMSGPRPVTKLPAKNFPIIFLPDPTNPESEDGIQVTPLSPAALLRDMSDLDWKVGQAFSAALKARTEEKKAAEKEDRKPVLVPLPPRGDWSRHAISAKPQNISGKIPKERKRLQVRLPEALNDFEAGLWRFLSGGAFPKIDDPQLEEYVWDYVDRLAAEETYSDPNIRRALDWSATRVLQTAYDFMADTVVELQALSQEEGIDGAQALKRLPRIDDLILSSGYWAREKPRSIDQVRKALSGSHFSKMKEAASK